MIKRNEIKDRTTRECISFLQQQVRKNIQAKNKDEATFVLDTISNIIITSPYAKMSDKAKFTVSDYVSKIAKKERLRVKLTHKDKKNHTCNTTGPNKGRCTPVDENKTCRQWYKGNKIHGCASM